MIADAIGSGLGTSASRGSSGMKFRLAVTLALMGALSGAGCSMVLDDNSVVYSAAPGKYDFLDCKGIAARITSTSERAEELSSLMTRARQDPMGPMVSNMVYRDEYNAKQADLMALRQAADQKRCIPEAKPATLKAMH
jgi:hypothetical protein